MKKVVLFAMGLVLLGSLARAEEINTGTVHKEIKRLNGYLMTPGDMDMSACGGHSNPGLVQGDFNGDGLTDFAALVLGTGTTPGRKEGRHHNKNSVWFVVFLNQGKGRFRRLFVARLDEGNAVQAFLEKVDLGKKFSAGQGGATAPKPIGIKLNECGKPCFIYYWDSNKNFFNRTPA